MPSVLSYCAVERERKWEDRRAGGKKKEAFSAAALEKVYSEPPKEQHYRVKRSVLFNMKDRAESCNAISDIMNLICAQPRSLQRVFFFPSTIKCLISWFDNETIHHARSTAAEERRLILDHNRPYFPPPRERLEARGERFRIKRLVPITNKSAELLFL